MSALTSQSGGMLTTLVEAQRGMSDAEAKNFLINNIVPDLSEAPDQDNSLEFEFDNPNEQVISESAAEEMLSTSRMTASSAFLSDNSHHSDELSNDANISTKTVQNSTNHASLEHPQAHENGESDSSLTDDFNVEDLDSQNLTADSGDHTTDGMIALIPDVTSQKKITVDGGELPIDLHLTLGYFPNIHLLPIELKKAIIDCVANYAVNMPSVIGDAFAVNMFNPTGDNPCVVLGVSGEQLQHVHDIIMEDVEHLFSTFGITMPIQHKPWIPHVTLIYTDDADLSYFTDMTGPITFDRLRLSWGNDNYDMTINVSPLESSSVDYDDDDNDINLETSDVMKPAMETFKERDVNQPGKSGHDLRNYWVHGEGAAKISWGTEGSFKRCVGYLGEHVKNPEGLCAEYHHAATGEWPRGGVPSAGSTEHFEADMLYDDTMPHSNVSDETKKMASWSGVLTVEGIESGDGRMFAGNALVWDEPPLPLMWQKETSHGGDNDTSVRVGSIDKIWREPDVSGRADVFFIHGSGTIDLGSEDGCEVHRRMKEKYMRGNSVDVDSVRDADVQFVYPQPIQRDGASTDITQQVTNAFAQPEVTIFTRGRIRATTLVEIPAFTEARLSLVDESATIASTDINIEITNDETSIVDTNETLMNAIVAATSVIEISDTPPREWFNEPTDVEATGALTVTSDGRVYGYVAPAKVRHRSYHDRDQYVPMKKVDYTRFMGGQTIVSDGGRVSTGNITMDCGHATTSVNLSGKQAADHYDNTCSIVATVCVGENKHGVWMAGALLPDVSPEQVRRVMACRLSGDWRPHLDRPGWREFVAALLVPVPGFPMARTSPSMSLVDGQLTASSIPVNFVVASVDDDADVDTNTNNDDVDQNTENMIPDVTSRDKALAARERVRSIRVQRVNEIRNQLTSSITTRTEDATTLDKIDKINKINALRARLNKGA